MPSKRLLGRRIVLDTLLLRVCDYTFNHDENTDFNQWYFKNTFSTNKTDK